MARKNRLLAIVLAFLFASSVVAPSNAYPPGRRITIATSTDMIVVCGKVPVSVANARPGNISIKVGKNAPIVVKQKGFSTKIIRVCRCGTHQIKVTSPVWRGIPDEVATTKLYVPCIDAPKTGPIGKKTVITLKHVKPGTVVTITPTHNKKKVCIILVKVPMKSTSTSITIPAFSFGKGSNNTYTITIGSKIKFNTTFTGT